MRCPSQPGQRILFSTRKGSSCLISEQALEALKQNSGSTRLIESLSKLGMLISETAQECEEIQTLPKTLDQISTLLRILIVPGMSCNFGCQYCYEGKKKTRQMSNETITQLINYIKELCSPKIKKIRLDFYGGEPLLYTEYIKKISTQLQNWAHKKGIGFVFTLVTNGSLLRPDLVIELKEFGLKAVRVTLDGPAEIHDKSRPFKNGNPSFNTIVKNLCDCVHLVSINVSSNYCQDNYRYFPDLLDILIENGLGPNQLRSVDFFPVLQTSGGQSQGFSKGCSWCGEPWVAEAALYLRGETLKKGFPVRKLTPSPCMMQRQNIYMVNWDGLLYKCPILINKNQFAVGSLHEQPGPSCMEEVNDWRSNKECKKCVYLPLCFGGCAAIRIERKGNVRGVDCWRPFYEKLIPVMIQQDLDALNKNQGISS